MDKQELIIEYMNATKFKQSDEEQLLIYENLKKQSKENPDMESFFQGLIFRKKGKYEEAVKAFLKAIKLDENITYPWYGLGLTYKNQKKYEEAIEAYRRAIELDEKFVYPWNGLGNLFFEQKKYEEAIEAYKRAIELDENYDYIWCNLGNLYKDQKRYEEAIEAYRRAIELDENCAYPWNGLGNLFNEQKRYEEAIEAYRRAIVIDEKFAYPWNGLGILYKEQKKYEEAIEAYRRAIELDEKFVYPWNGLGNLFFEQKKYEEAIEAYRRAIELKEDYASPWHNLGNLYKEQKKYEEAIEAYKKAMKIDDKFIGPVYNLALLFFYDLEELELAKEYFERAKIKCENDNESYMASKCIDNLEKVNKALKRKKLLEQMKAKVDNVENNHKDKSMNDKSYQIISRTISMKKSINNKKKEFTDFITSPKVSSNDSDYVEILRRWNSYTPIIANNYHISKGGGYFLNINNKGVVIDPGFNFIDNFKGSGHVFTEIDSVIISHAHNDHTADLESILTLLFKYNDNLKGIDDEESDWTIRAEIAKEKNIDIKKVNKDDILKSFEHSDRKKIIEFYMPLSVFKKYSGLFDLYDRSNYKIHCIEREQEFWVNNKKAFVIMAKHNDIISDSSSVGIVIEVDGTIFVYSGDTGWSQEIEEVYKRIHNKYQDKKIVLIAHLGGFKDKEENYLDTYTSKHDKYDQDNWLYPNHLGRHGLIKINETLLPNICFISEFGEEFKGLRKELTSIFNQIFKQDNVSFIPADIGLKCRFSDLKIKAVVKVGTEDNMIPEEGYDYIPYSNVDTVLLRTDYSLHYYNKEETSFTESDVIQAITKSYYTSTN